MYERCAFYYPREKKEKKNRHLICCKTGSNVCGKMRNIVKLHVFCWPFYCSLDLLHSRSLGRLEAILATNVARRHKNQLFRRLTLPSAVQTPTTNTSDHLLQDVCLMSAQSPSLRSPTSHPLNHVT